MWHDRASALQAFRNSAGVRADSLVDWIAFDCIVDAAKRDRIHDFSGGAIDKDIAQAYIKNELRRHAKSEQPIREVNNATTARTAKV